MTLDLNSTKQELQDLNSKLEDIIDYTSQITPNEVVVDNLWSTSIKKIGHNVNFIINITVKAASSGSIHVGTLPLNVTPKRSICLNTITNAGVACYIYVDPDGKFGFTKISGTSWALNEGIRACFSYMMED